MSVESSNTGFSDAARIVANQSREEKVIENQPDKGALLVEQEKLAVKMAEQAKRSDNEVDIQDTVQAAEALLRVAQNLNQDIQFSLQEAPNSSPIIQVIDRETGDVIRQIPSDDFLKLAGRMQSLTQNEQLDSATGLLIDSRV
ncbi:flagellar protein FlaG [Aliidiomarina maris]|nr:flagellar protein FlaG [Aliidiomarina maris]RAK00740.1 flagellar protein FlaG [Aliidiomarina maris]